MTNTDPWEPLMTEYGFSADEIRDNEPTEPYRHDCGRLVIRFGDEDNAILEDADEDGGVGTEHECDHTDDVVEEPIEQGPRPLAELLAVVNALIPSEPDHTSTPDQAEYRRLTEIAEGAEPTPAEVASLTPRRANTSHADCSHPATKAARAKCRRARAQG